MKLLRFAVIACAVLLASCSDAPKNRITAPSDGQGVTKQDASNDESIDVTNRWIVVFKSSVQDVDGMVDQLSKAHGGQVHYRYKHALKGYAVTLPAQAIEGIKHNPNVDYVEADQVMSINTDQTNPPSWGLNRVDQQSLPMDNKYVYNYNGSGVDVYIIDTGIRFSHLEFNGRARKGVDEVTLGGTATDCNGHGTHVAGTIGGANVGIAKGVTLYAVRVLNCKGSGTNSGVIAGINWVVQNKNAERASVANMSLGGSKSDALNKAVADAVKAGVTFVVAAGNENTDAATKSPSSEPLAITVAATTNSDSRASYSNYGAIVDVFAPGSGIYSSVSTSDNSYAVYSGTSMASPHVAGIAALYLAAHPSATPADVDAAIKGSATWNVVTDPGPNTLNRLVCSLFPNGITMPLAPSGISGSATSTASIQLTWTNNATNPSGFVIERSTDNVNYSYIMYSGTLPYIDNTVAKGTAYYYRVRAYDANGWSGYSGPISVKTPRR